MIQYEPAGKHEHLNKCIIFGLLMFLISCAPEKEQVSDIKVLPNNSTAISVLDHVEYVEIIALETVVESLLRNVISVQFADDFIFVSDTDGSVFSFKRCGRFVARIGRRGQGPEDHLSSLAFFVDERNRHVVLIDVARRAFIKHDFYGRFQGVQQIPLEAIRETQNALLMDDGTLLLNRAIMTMLGETNRAYTALSGYNFQYIEMFSPYYPITAENHMMVFSNHPMVRTGDGGVNFIMPINDTIFNFHNGKVIPKYRVELPERRMRMAPRERFQTTIENNLFSMMFYYGHRGYFTGFTGIFETDNFILLNYRRHGIVMAHYFYDRRSGIGGYALYSTPPGKLPFHPVIFSNGNAFVSAIEAEALLDLKEGFDRNDPNNTRLFEVLDNLQFDDNHVLLLYHMR